MSAPLSPAERNVLLSRLREGARNLDNLPVDRSYVLFVERCVMLMQEAAREIEALAQVSR